LIGKTTDHRRGYTIHTISNQVEKESINLNSGTKERTSMKDGFFTTTDGVKLHYLEAGSGSTLLFIPGWIRPAWLFERQIESFSQKHRVIALDPRSQGHPRIDLAS
jgi:hypothetical protein